MTMDVEEECKQLVKEIERIGGESKNGNDNTFCTYGQLFDDDVVQNTFEALMGTLKAAKKRKLINANLEFPRCLLKTMMTVNH